MDRGVSNLTEHKEHKEEHDEQPQVTNSQVTVAEARIRQIAREEIAKWEKQALQVRRYGPPGYMETKYGD